LVIFIADEPFYVSKKSFDYIGAYKHEKESDEGNEKSCKQLVTKIDDCEVDFCIIDFTRQFEKEYSDAFTIINSNTKNVFSDINKLLHESSHDFYCIIPSSFFPEYNFLLDLIVSYCEISNSGVIGIVSELRNVEHSYALCYEQDNKQVVMYSPIIKGLLFFSKYIIEAIGYFDSSENILGCEMEQYCMRSHLLGYNNYYVDNSVALYPKMKIYEYAKLNESINKMKEAKNFYVHLSTD